TLKLQHIESTGSQSPVKQSIVGIDEQADAFHTLRHAGPQRLQQLIRLDMSRRARVAPEPYPARPQLHRSSERLGGRRTTALGLNGHRSFTPASRAMASAAARGSAA